MVVNSYLDDDERTVVVITTSRNPNEFTRRVAKLLNYSIPFSFRINRGSKSLKELFKISWSKDSPKLIIVHSMGKDNKEIAELSLFSFNKNKLVDKNIIFISDMAFPIKHSAETRVEIRSLMLDFNSSISNKERLHIKRILLPILTLQRPTKIKSLGIIYIDTISNSHIIGKFIKETKTEKRIIFSFRVQKNNRGKKNDRFL